MKKRIYLFCNDRYGAAYQKVFQDAVRELCDFECHIVYSSKGLIRRRKQKIVHVIRHPLVAIACYVRKLILRSSGMAIIEVADVNHPDFLSSIPEESIGFIAGFNQIFKKNTIEKFFTLINFHPSLLPYYRGAIPSYWVLKNNEKLSGFSAHFVTEKVDAGAILFQQTIKIDDGMTEPQLDAKIANAGAIYLKECLQRLQSGRPFRLHLVAEQYSTPSDYISAVRD